jgi:hypothetical protein
LDRHRSDFAYLAALSPSKDGGGWPVLVAPPCTCFVLQLATGQEPSTNSILTKFRTMQAGTYRGALEEKHFVFLQNLILILLYSIFVSAWSKALKLLSTERFGPIFSPTPPVICT